MKLKINFPVLSLLLLFLGGTFYFFYSNNLISDPIAIIYFIRGFQELSYVIFFFLIILEVLVAPIPGAVFYAIGGALFGTFIGGTIGLVANIIGASIAFYLGKKLIVEKEKDEMRLKLDRMIEKYGGYAIFFLRVNPFTSSDAFSYLAGFSGMRFKPFIVGTALGLIPLIYIQSYFGGLIIQTNTLLVNIFLIASAIYLAIFIYLIFDKNLLKWIKKKLFHS